MAKRRKKNYNCKLFPYERIDCLSIQYVKQKAGWNITAFDLPKAWDKSQGEGVTIAVLDTGCDLNHPDLNDNLLPGMNFVELGKPPIDRAGHGSHVTGTICAENNDLGVVGVAPKAKVRPVKVLGDNGNGDLRDVSKGIRWAVAQKVDFIQMSLGAPFAVQEVRKAIQFAAKKGVICFVAAGNAGRTKEIFYPAAYPETIAIGAIDKNMRRADFSNTGRRLDFMAPGVSILSTVPNDWYAEMNGTSMAAPFACGVAALVLSYVRNNNIKIKLNTPQDYRNLFRKHTTPIKGNKNKFYQGFGIIDPTSFLESLS